jgi:GTP-binding protein EngB required for normal cell division
VHGQERLLRPTFKLTHFIVLIGMPGHGHMMMLDKNNDKIAQWIIDWLVRKGL